MGLFSKKAKQPAAGSSSGANPYTANPYAGSSGGYNPYAALPSATPSHATLPPQAQFTGHGSKYAVSAQPPPPDKEGWRQWAVRKQTQYHDYRHAIPASQQPGQYAAQDHRGPHQHWDTRHHALKCTDGCYEYQAKTTKVKEEGMLPYPYGGWTPKK